MPKQKQAFIPLSEPVFNGNEKRYLGKCIEDGWVSSSGPYNEKFEKATAAYLGVRNAVSVINGTSALHLALLAAGVSHGDAVIVPTLTFVAPVNAILYCGARPIFMDCDAATLCLDVVKLAEFLKTCCSRGKDGVCYEKTTRRRIRAVIPVDIFGHPADMDILNRLASDYGLTIIEDATESLGSLYKNRKAGGLSTVGCLSFNGNKIMTSGGGGMVVTNDDKVASYVRHLSTQAKKDGVYYDHDALGYNYRLSNLHAAVGLAQLERLDTFVKIRRKNHQLYCQNFDGVDEIGLYGEAAWAKSNFWLNTISVSASHRNPLMKYLWSKGVGVRPVWKLMHTLSMYHNDTVFAIEEAPKVYASSFNLPSSAGLKKADIQEIVRYIRAYFKV